MIEDPRTTELAHALTDLTEGMDARERRVILKVVETTTKGLIKAYAPVLAQYAQAGADAAIAWVKAHPEAIVGERHAATIKTVTRRGKDGTIEVVVEEQAWIAGPPPELQP